MKNFVQAWSDKTQVRLGQHRKIVISGVFRGRENEYLQTTAMGRDFPGIFGDTVFVNTCPLFDNFNQSFAKKTSGRHKNRRWKNLKKLVLIILM